MNSSLPLVSVVIPVFNRSHLISRTLKSVQQQTYSNIEVIIVDDCSDDSEQLKGVIAQFKQLNISYIRHERNKHGGASRNTGIKASRGKYIAFLDSDDTWSAEKVQVCIKTLEEKNLQFVYTQLRQDHISDKVFPSKGIISDEPVADYLINNLGTIQTSSIVISRDLASRYLFDESLKRFQDYDFVINLDIHGIRPTFIAMALTLMHSDDDGRISQSYNAEPAVKWIEKVKPVISFSAYENFYLNRVVRYQKMSGDTILATRKVLSFKSLSPLVKLKWLFICLTPRAVLKTISKAIR